MEGKPVVFVIDDDANVREALRILIESAGMEVRDFGSAEEFLAAGPPSGPGCLVLDVCLPGLSGPDLQKELQDRDVELPILVVTGFSQVSTAVQTLKAGALDFLEKPVQPDVLLMHIREAVERSVSSSDERRRVGELKRRLGLLSRRQREVMDRVVAGQSSKGIAAELGLSPKTVEAHRARLMAKLQADSLAELVRTAMLASNPAENNKQTRG